MNKFGYITVCTKMSYVGGVLVLEKSLRKVESKYPFYCVVPKYSKENVAIILKEKGIRCIEVDDLPSSIMERKNEISYWKDTFFKLTVFNLLEFQKIVFLDSDMFVLNNVDELFEFPHISAAAAGIELHPTWTLINSGIMVIEPNERDYLGLLDCIDEVYNERSKRKLGVGDQDVINRYFSGWLDMEQCHLSGRYNVMLGYGGLMYKAGSIKKEDEINIYHFTGKEKPWRGIRELMIITAKIAKRSRGLIDFRILIKYRKLFRTVK